jgi:hypothetical protein
MKISYEHATTPGWIAIAARSTALIVESKPPDAVGQTSTTGGPGATGQFSSTAFEAAKSPAGFQAVLDLLMTNGLASTPSFVLVDWADTHQTRIIVRGPVAVTVTDASGATELSGAGISTWTERVVDGLRELTFRETVSSDAAQTTALALPLESGAVAVSSVRFRSAPEPAAPGIEVPEAEVSEVSEPAEMSEPAEPAEPAESLGTAESTIVLPDLFSSSGLDETIVATHLEDLDGPDGQSDVSPEPEAPTEAQGYDYLFGETMFRSVSDAAVRIDPEPEFGEEPPSDPDAETDSAGDHDGQTIMTSDLAKLRGRRRAAESADGTGSDISTPAAPTPAPPPPAAPTVVLRLSTGAIEPLDRPILLGRGPSINQVSGAALPRLVTVGSPEQDISRTHARFALEGGTVVVTDLHSRNGTVIILPGKSPQKLRAGEPTTVLLGTVVDFGSGLSLEITTNDPTPGSN